MAMVMAVVIALSVLISCGASIVDSSALWSSLQGTLPPPSVQEAAARGVIRRFLPRHAPAFELGIISLDACGGKPCFHVTSSKVEGTVKIRINGTTGVELCAGFHWYLKNFCGAHISWDATGGSQLTTVPEPHDLPALPPGGANVQRPVPWNYYQNVVTSSYSYVWWNFKRWKKEVDWMALQGINLPLAFTGQEAIWQKVFQNMFNLTKRDLDDYFGGPAFLAWARMGNLHGWGGPLPQNWLDSQLRLQKRILRHMRSLGMIAVLPAFSGNVPSALKALYPSANITRLPEWNTVDGNPKWCCTYLLQPTDPLFIQIGRAFVKQQAEEYGGTQHIYNCDTFNENLPPTNDPSYISSLAAAVFSAMTAADEDAVWLMQGWLFSNAAAFWQPPQMKALLHAVPFGKMIVLDLFAEVKPIWAQTNHFYGVPYIWCMLHNFGGNHEMYGRLDMLLTGPIDARTSANSTMVGVGMCMEGIEQNPVVYELMGEMAFRSHKSNLRNWVDNYSIRRYGQDTSAKTAWRILSQTVYNCSDGIADHNTDVVVKFPDMNASNTSELFIQGTGTQARKLLSSEGLAPFGHLWFPLSEARLALSCMLNASNVLENSAPYRYDLVDLTRQLLSKMANEVFLDVLLAFGQGNTRELEKKSDRLLGLISDLETVLGSNYGFLLGPWLESAKQLAINQQEMELYEWNARTQVTMWFDNTEDLPSVLHDYANKMWSGLVGDYYLPRASLYVKLLQEALHDKKLFPFQRWRREWISLTNKWQNATDVYPSRPMGNSVALVKLAYKKYTPSFNGFLCEVTS